MGTQRGITHETGGYVMGYSIEVYFEPRFEETIRSVWNALAEAGVPSIMQTIGSRPHLSLLVLDACNPARVADLMDRVIDGKRRFPIRFAAFSVIPGHTQTVFLTPAISPTLIAMQREFYCLLVENGYGVRKNYAPHRWLPHCSISKELTPADALKTLAICQATAAVGETCITDVGFIEFRPRKEIKTVALASG
jgi:hypothetical protein